MEKKMVPLKKMSKKKQRELFAQKRSSWNGVNPASRIVPSGKTFKRSAMKSDTRSIMDQDV